MPTSASLSRQTRPPPRQVSVGTAKAALVSQLALLAGVLAAGQMIFVIVSAWTMMLGLAIGQTLAQIADVVLGSKLSMSNWLLDYHLLLGFACTSPLLCRAATWLRAPVDPHAAGPISALGVDLRPGPVAIITGAVCGLMTSCVMVALSGASPHSWVVVALAGAGVNGVVLVWRAGATWNAGRWRSVALWLFVSVLSALCVGGPAYLA